MTPGQLNRHLEAHSERQRRDYALTLTGAWWSAGFERMKKMPPLARVLARLDKRPQRDKPRQSWQDMKAVALQWIAHMRAANKGKKP